jgi:peptide-methionine (S)-S-oxide reductase
MKTIAGISAIILLIACNSKINTNQFNQKTLSEMENETNDTATLGQGCFWCAQAIFSDLKGVREVRAGFSGGKLTNPTYEEVCDGNTGHAEVVQIIYDPKQISYTELLEVFWKTHDPTTLNRQGADIGTQYRSVIFYHTAQQKDTALLYIEKLNKSGAFTKKIVTEVLPFTVFYEAEEYHQDYFRKNPENSYCQIVIGPKIEKFEKVFAGKLK